LKKIFSEGFSPTEVEAYRKKTGVLRTLENDQVPQVRKQLDEVRKLIEGSTGEKKEKVQAIESRMASRL